MTPIEITLIVILIALIGVLVYYFFSGSTGKIAISRPIESRLDEYLDRKFDRIIEEWSLVREPDLQRFKTKCNGVINKDAEDIQTLTACEAEITQNLNDLEGRLDLLENSLISKTA